MFRSKKLSLVCCMMIVAGLLLSAAGYLLGGRVWGVGLNRGGVWVNSPNIEKRQGCRYVKETKELEAFTGIDADTDFGDLVIEASDHYGISYNVPEDCEFSVNVEDGMLKVVKKTRAVLGIQGNFVVIGSGNLQRQWEEEYITIYVPAGAEFDTVRLADGSGEVAAKDITAQSLTVEAGFGNVELEQISGGEARILLESGKLTMSGLTYDSLTIEDQFGEAVLADIRSETSEITMESGDFKAEASELGELVLVQKFGAVRLCDVSCGEAKITSESGEIRLEGVTAAAFDVKSSFGDVEGEAVSAAGGTFELESGACILRSLDIPTLSIDSDFGDVKLTLASAVAEYMFDLDTEFGDVEIDHRDMGSAYRSLETREKSVVVRCDSGNIRIESGK